MAKQHFTPKKLETEEWRDIPGYEGIYRVSNLGRVRSLGRVDRFGRVRPETLLKQFKSPNRYPVVSIYKQGHQRQVAVHRLVMWAFTGPQGDWHVHHKNGKKDDNRLENLEYVTPQRNNIERSRALREKRFINGKAVLTPEQVKKIRKTYELGLLNQEQLARAFQVDRSQIGNIVRYEQWTWLE